MKHAFCCLIFCLILSGCATPDTEKTGNFRITQFYEKGKVYKTFKTDAYTETKSPPSVTFKSGGEGGYVVTIYKPYQIDELLKP